MDQLTLNGCQNADGRRIVVIQDGNHRLVVVEGRPYMRWDIRDVLTERVAIVQLYEMKFGSQEEIAAAFQISIKSVYNYIRMFAATGCAGLPRDRRGPKSNWKITAEVRGKILYLFLKEGFVEYEKIKEKLAAWGEEVGITSIRQVLRANGLVKEVSVFEDLANPHELFQNDICGQQLQFGFEWDQGLKAGADGETDHPPAIGAHKKADLRARSEPRAMRYYSPCQRMYWEQLKQGSYNSYAGGLLFTPFLSQYPFLSTLQRIIDMPAHEGYSLEELSLTLFYFDVFGFRSMEDFKRAYPEEFGLLIGRPSSPSNFSLRRFLHKVRKLAKSEDLIEAFASMYLRTGLAKWGVLYIDGHFLPYYGMYSISKGWHGVRQMAMKGSYHFLGVDENFAPWIFLVRSSSEDLLEKIPEMIEKAQRAAHSAGIGEKQHIDDLIVVFDREGFSGKLYGYLDGRDRDDQKKRAIFVSWAKYADKWVYEIPSHSFDKKVVVTYEIRKPEETKYCETERRMSKYGKIRTIVIERRRDGKRMAIYTNGRPEEISSERAVQLICRRWGEENLIKELLGKHFINYMPGYVREGMEEQPLVDNPRVKQLKEQRGLVVNELHKLKVQLADKILRMATDETHWQEIKHKEIQLLTEIVERQHKMETLVKEMESLPAKLPYDQAYQGKKLEKLSYEKKRFLDCMKIYAYHAQRWMGKLLLNHYDREKEILPTLSMIVRRGGTVKYQGGRLRVQLRRFANPEIDDAARGLCEDLNKVDLITPDRFRLPIWFEVAE